MKIYSWNRREKFIKMYNNMELDLTKLKQNILYHDTIKKKLA